MTITKAYRALDIGSRLASSALGHPSVVTINGIDRYIWTDGIGQLAYATEGCQTVVVRKTVRSLIEEIGTSGPTDLFGRTVATGWGSTLNAGKWAVRTGVDADFHTDGAVGHMVIDAANSSKRIAPSSYGYDYNQIDVETDVEIDKLPVGDTLYAGHLIAYQDVSNHYLTTLEFAQGTGYDDTFGRDTASGWGGSWTTVGTAGDYSTTAATGLATHSLGSLNSSRKTSVPASVDHEVLTSCDFATKPTGGSVYSGIALRYTDTNNHYTIRLRCNTGSNNAEIELRKHVSGTASTIGSAVSLGVVIPQNEKWWIRARIVGTTIQARAWKDGTSEPGSWQIDTTDATHTTGSRAGCISITSTTTSNTLPFLVRYYDFTLTPLSESVATRISLQKRVAGVVSTIASFVTTSNPYVVGDTMAIKTHWVPGSLSAKAWNLNNSEPADYQVTATDSTFNTGDVGVRAILNPNGTNFPIDVMWDAYNVDATWSNPPTVTDTSRVFISPTPLASDPSADWGANGASFRSWLINKIKGTDLDVLGTCFTYTKNQANESLYGPTDPTTGLRLEGGDWNDFLGVVGHYVGSGEANDNPEVAEFGCMDCSGFARMILGYTFQLPMSRAAQDPGDFIPRVTADQWEYSPGILIYSDPDDHPDLTDPDIDLMPGDWLFWDATSDPEEEEGQIDHCGIYIGLDIDGKHRFISSRKTVNGPTFSDIGGKSILDGTGLYALKLRKIRRV